MFIHLHNHSHYSLLDGLPKIKDYVAKCLEYKMPAMALTDHGVLYGAIEFYQKAKDAGIKPIIGIETYVAPRRLIYKKPKLDDKPSHLILLAKDNDGYKNLIELATIAQLDGFYYKPRLDKVMLKKYSKGLIATSACWAGEINRYLFDDRLDEAKKAVKEYQDIFGKENFFLEMVYLGEGVKRQDEFHNKVKVLAKKTKAPLIATKDTHYLDVEDAEAQDALMCITTGTTLDDTKRLSMMGMDLSFTHPKLMEERFKDTPEAVENTNKIANSCNVNLDLGKWLFPAVDLPKGKNADESLKEIAFAELEKKRGQISDIEKERLEFELDIIKKKGYSPYFISVADLINWARSQGIVTTTRGSAAGSLVSFAIGIIDIDPMFFGLPFERFLNPFRPSPPDVDMDFADNRREEVINYARAKYGDDHVAQICTFGTMAARGSVRDVTRVLGYSYDMGDKLAKMIPIGSQGFPMTIAKAMEINPELQSEYDRDPNAKRAIDLAMKIEGCARHSSIHAAGTLISPTKITDYVPLQRDPSRRKKITQFEMKSSEAAGLLKFDFLGITNLSIIGEAIKIIEKTKGDKVDIINIPLDDQKTFDLLARGQTVGLFQLSGEGMTKYLVDLKPSNIFDIAAMVALYRPGPMESIPEFVERKHDPSKITYLDERLKNILDKSYGIITYQDDVMLISIHLAGYTWEEADKFRKAMGKKIPEEMAKQEGKFREGCLKNGLTEEKTDALWDLIKPFASYGFNKAHAASYGMVAYRTAFLKANYPAEYMTSLLSIESGDEEKISKAVYECQRMGINVLPPDVNTSRKDFTYIADNEIRFGMLAIKNLGADIVTSVYNERKENGEFKSLEDFLYRCRDKGINKKSIEALSMAGAMDSLADRNLIVSNIDNILNYLKRVKAEKDSRQVSLFDIGKSEGEDSAPPINLDAADPATTKQKLAWEKELLGIYVTDHPFAETSRRIDGRVSSAADVKNLESEQKVMIAGTITAVKHIFTKKNEPMCFVNLEDISSGIEVVVFPKTLAKNKEVWVEGLNVVVVGNLSLRKDDPSVLADTALVLDDKDASEVLQSAEVEFKKSNGFRRFGNGNGGENGNGYNHLQNGAVTAVVLRQVWVKLPRFFNSEVHSKIKEVFISSPGKYKVYISVDHAGGARKIETNYKIEYNESIKKKLEKITGQDSVSVKED